MGGSPKRERTPIPVAPPPPPVEQQPLAKSRVRTRRSLRRGVGRQETILAGRQDQGAVVGTIRRLLGGGGQ